MRLLWAQETCSTSPCIGKKYFCMAFFYRHDASAPPQNQLIIFSALSPDVFKCLLCFSVVFFDLTVV